METSLRCIANELSKKCFVFAFTSQVLSLMEIQTTLFEVPNQLNDRPFEDIQFTLMMSPRIWFRPYSELNCAVSTIQWM